MSWLFLKTSLVIIKSICFSRNLLSTEINLLLGHAYIFYGLYYTHLQVYIQQCTVMKNNLCTMDAGFCFASQSRDALFYVRSDLEPAGFKPTTRLLTIREANALPTLPS